MDFGLPFEEMEMTVSIILKKNRRTFSAHKKVVVAALLATSALVSLAAFPRSASAFWPESSSSSNNNGNGTGKNSETRVVDGVQDYEANNQMPKEKTALKVSLSGHLDTALAVGAWDKHGDSKTDNVFVAIPDLSLQFMGQTTLNDKSFFNGLSLGSVIRIHLIDTSGTAQSSGVTTAMKRNIEFDRAYIFMQNHTGQYQIGSVEGPTTFMHYSAPWFIKANGVDSPNLSNSPAASPSVRDNTYAYMSYHSNKIAYYSPRIGGDSSSFQVGVAFTPDTRSRMTSAHARPYYDDEVGPDGRQGKVRDVLEAAINYKAMFKKFALALDAHFADALKTYDNPGVKAGNPKEMGLGCNVLFSLNDKKPGEEGAKTLTLGAALYTSMDIQIGTIASARKNDKMYVWALGLSYLMDKWKLGFGYLQAMGKSKDDFKNNARNMAFQIGGGYKVTDGLESGISFDFLNDKAGKGSKALNGYAMNLFLSVDF